MNREQVKELLFSKVHCTGYLKKVYDGKFIEVIEGDVKEAVYRNSNDDDFEEVSECCGDLDFLKTYYEIKEKHFNGFLVGFKEIVATGYLVADTGYDFRSCEHLTIHKEPKDIYECAIVYFADNRKRLVPLEKIK
jgi:hypothetical protein